MKRLALLVAFFGVPAVAQVATGTQPLATIQSNAIDSIDLGSLNVHIDIPVISFAGRGLPFDYVLGYDSTVWSPSSAGWQPAADWGWSAETSAAVGYLAYNQTTASCGGGHIYAVRTAFVYYDALGAAHPFGGASWNNNICGMSAGNWNEPASDNSGFKLALSSSSTSATVSSPSGVVIAPPLGSGTGGATVTDSNGNQITTSSGMAFTDTVGNTALTISTGPSERYYTWTNPAGGASTVTVYFSGYNVQTAFGCPGVAEYSSTSAVSLPTTIELPTGDYWSISYEATPGYAGYITGRIASITSPYGATISYAYSPWPGGYSPINCADGSTAKLTRTTPDSSTPWTYSRYYYSGITPQTSLTGVVTPAGDRSLYYFCAFNTMGSSGTLYSYFQSGRETYSGSSTLLSESSTSFNGSFGAVPTFPISQLATIAIVPNGYSGGLQSQRVTDYNSDGLPTEVDEYDWGSGAPGALLRKTTTSYASLSGIVGNPSVVAVYNGTGGLESQTSYTYSNTVVSTSGVPQHTTPSGDRGNVASIATLVGGSTALTQSFTYYDTGNLYQATDVNGAVTTAGYGSGSCSQSFADTISEPLSLSRSQTWNCTGEVATASPDENGNGPQITGWDPDYWRPTQVTDAAGNVTNISYPSFNQVKTELDFNSGASTVTTLATADSQGRPWLSQQQEGPSSSTWDTVETDYDVDGRAYRQSAPYTSSAGIAAGSVFTTTAFDGLDRPVSVSPPGASNVVTYGYTQNDTLITVAAPSSESSKQRQLEYDGAGRLSSVCELTGATGSGTCGQNVAQTGFWTLYANNTAGQITEVEQNAQGSSPQYRYFSFDGLGRLTQEINPESGTVAYSFDSDSTCGTSSGDMVKRVDNMGNVTCTVYDALHRATDITYPSGSYASATPAKHFVFDAATVGGTTMANPKGRMVEAYTGSSGSKTTDLGFSYSVLGQTAGVWEATPNSAGYYTASATYWPNGAPATLTALGMTTKSYGVDAMGRVSSITDPSYTSPVPASSPINYNIFGEPVSVTLGSGDNDSYSFDAATGRMTQYQFTVGGQTDTGTLGWNANGSLGSLTIADGLSGTADSQGCSYTEDDLGRIATVNCANGSTDVWDQYFGDDAFGGVTKTVGSGTGVAFDASYSPATNQISSVGGFTPYYDANGNLLDDPVLGWRNVYEWDAEGRPTSIEGAGVTTDALGRIVEIDNPYSGPQQQFFSPDGGLFAWLEAGTLLAAELPLPGGGNAFYQGVSSGPADYFHADWLGSLRLVSNASGAPAGSGAYGPYGDNYAAGAGGSPNDFTGQLQDVVNWAAYGPTDFPLREYSRGQSRWLTPDPLGLGAVDPTDPQTWNRYAYVRGNPLEMTDPFGLVQSSKGPPPNPPPAGCTVVWDSEHVNWWLICLFGFGPPASPVRGPGGSGGDGAGGNGNSPTPPPTPRTAPPPPATKCDQVPNDPNAKGVDKYIDLYARVTRPFELLAASGGAFVASGYLYVYGGALAAGGCLEPTPAEPLTCIAGVGGATVSVAAGTAMAGTGSLIFAKAVIPAFKSILCAQ